MRQDRTEHRRVRSLVASCSLSAALALGSSFAWAQQTQPAAEDPARVEEARNQYRAGVQSFQRQRFPEATVAFERSFRARPHPATLYNAAEARMRAGDQAGAIEQLRELLGMTTPAPDEELVSRARALAQQMGQTNLQAVERQAAPSCPVCPRCAEAPTCPPPPPAERVTTHTSPMAWALAGASLAFVGAGSAFFAVALDNASTYNDARLNDSAGARAVREDLKDQGELYRVLGIAGLVLGAGAAAGATYFFLHPREQSAAPASPMARLNVGVGLGGLSLSGQF